MTRRALDRQPRVEVGSLLVVLTQVGRVSNTVSGVRELQENTGEIVERRLMSQCTNSIRQATGMPFTATGDMMAVVSCGVPSRQ